MLLSNGCCWFSLLFRLEKKLLSGIRADLTKKSYCKTRNIMPCVTPGGMTSYLEAGDIVCYKPFKDHLSGKIETWKLSDQVRYTYAGNPKTPQTKVVCEWVSESWRKIESDAILSGLEAAGHTKPSERSK